MASHIDGTFDHTRCEIVFKATVHISLSRTSTLSTVYTSGLWFSRLLHDSQVTGGRRLVGLVYWSLTGTSLVCAWKINRVLKSLSYFSPLIF